MTQSLGDGWLDVADNFPKQSYEAVAKKASGIPRGSIGRQQHGMAWTAVAYRFRTFDDHSNAFKRHFLHQRPKKARPPTTGSCRIASCLAFSSLDLRRWRASAMPCLPSRHSSIRAFGLQHLFPLKLSEREAVQLQSLGRRLASNSVWRGDTEPPDRSVIDCWCDPTGQWKILVREAVGVIAVGELQISVQPKIPLNHFLYLATQSQLVPRIDEQVTTIGLGANLWDLVARWFLSATERLLRRELAKGYIDVSDELEVVRGRILPLETAVASYQARPVAYCEYEEFNENIALNRVIKAAAELVASSTLLDNVLRRRAKAIIARMTDASEVMHVDLRSVSIALPIDIAMPLHLASIYCEGQVHR
jgi:hypothetical protein